MTRDLVRRFVSRSFVALYFAARAYVGSGSFPQPEARA